MTYVTTGSRSRRKTRRPIDIKQKEFSKGYISTIAASRRPQNSLADLTNMEIVQDGIPRPRPSLVAYGTQPTQTICGRGNYTKSGSRYELFMQDNAGVGRVYKRIDGGSFSLIGTGGSYDESVWSHFVQSNDKVYIYNGVDNLSYIDLNTNAVVTYTSLSTPGAPTATRTALGTNTFTYYYKIAANNGVGTSAASTAGTVQVSKLRENWNGISATVPEYVTVTWSAVTNATSYNIYVGDSAGNEFLLYTVGGNATTTFIDDGSIFPDVSTLAPSGNSTQGQVFRWMYNDARSSQLFGLDNNNVLWYSAAGTGDFSPYNGGGNVPIDEYGDTQLNYVDGFRDGKGNPVVTVSARGAAGKGKMFHATPDTITYGDQVIAFFNIYEANGQYAPYSARAVIKAKDALFYPTGADFKSTGTSQNIVNILTTQSISQVIEPDVETISLAYLYKSVGVEYKDKLYWALPISSTYNNQIWYMDTARKNLWVLRWTFTGEIKDLWLVEDSTGSTHFCVLIDNRILEFSRNASTEDDGVAFRSRVAYSSLVWDEAGLVMANIRKMYFKFLNPKGDILVNVYGIDKEGAVATLADDTYSQTVTFTGYDVWMYDEHLYDEDVGTIESFGKSIDSLPVKTNAKLINQLDWEVVTESVGCDYLLSAVETIGNTNDQRKLGD